MKKSIEYSKSIERSQNSIECPSCSGFAELVESNEDEIRNYKYNCRRDYACCCRAFVCKICGVRIIGRAEAPEMEY